METAVLETLQNKLLNPVWDLSNLTAEEQFNLIMSKVGQFDDSVINPEELRKKLETAKSVNKQLVVKFGIDPTGSQIHLGHAVVLLKLQLMQRMGHKIQFVVGDFTAQIGDPSGKNKEREPLTKEQIEKNLLTYKEQASRVIDFDSPNVSWRFNSEWMRKLTITEWVEFLKKINVKELLQREDFQKRMKTSGITMAELEYAMFMGYDSVILKPDIELGGKDQFLNLLMCRRMMELDGQNPEVFMSFNVLPGTTGGLDEEGRPIKMSKSLNNIIPIESTPEDMFREVMSSSDDIIWMWFRELTLATGEDISILEDAVKNGVVDVLEVKKVLARVLVATFNNWDKNIIIRAENSFNPSFSKTKNTFIPDDVEIFKCGTDERLIDVLCKMGKTKSQIRRDVKGNGIRIFESIFRPVAEAELNAMASDFDGSVIRIGRNKFLKIVVVH